MSIVRRAVRLALPLLVVACSDGVAPTPPPPASAPHFLRWAPPVPALAAGASGIARAPGALSSAGAQIATDFVTSWPGHSNMVVWPHVVGFAANRLLVVVVSIRDAQDTVSSVTFGATPLSLLGTRNSADSAARVELWYLVAPPPGWDSVRVQLSKVSDVVAGALSLSGADQASPFGAWGASGSVTSQSDTAALVLPSAMGDLVIAALAVNGNPKGLTVYPGQTALWSSVLGSTAAGAGGTLPGADTVTVGWTFGQGAKWAMGAVSVHPAPWTGPALDQSQVSVWAVRGQQRSVLINYLGTLGGAPQPFLRLDVTDPISAPGIGAIAVGDSVLITVTVDPASILVQLEPSGIQFGQPAHLQLWYGGAGGDLNGDGVADGTDTDIETRLLKLWCQAGPAEPWAAIPAVRSADKTFAADLGHFSNYAVAF